MSDPVFENRTPRLGLPLLFSGQAQKELHHNEALSRIDGLLCCVVEGIENAPPEDAEDGMAWVVGPAATADWASRSGQIAKRQSGQWLFQAPVDGLTVTDRATGQVSRFFSEWLTPETPSAPQGGAVIDVQARAALTGIIDSLKVAGIFSSA
jgi:hypothetical protein